MAGFQVVPYDPERHRDGPWLAVRSVFEEYGFPFAEHDYDADLRAPQDAYDGVSGWFWVAEAEDGSTLGCVGLSDEGEGLFELHRLYVRASARRLGIGERLVARVIEKAGEHGCRRLVLYSDIAFGDAHRLYRKLGFRCHRFRYAPDPWASREWGFEQEIATAARAEHVDSGRSSG